MLHCCNVMYFALSVSSKHLFSWIQTAMFGLLWSADMFQTMLRYNFRVSCLFAKNDARGKIPYALDCGDPCAPSSHAKSSLMNRSWVAYGTSYASALKFESS